MRTFISVVSHGHSELINSLQCLNQLSKEFVVVVKSNKLGDDFGYLIDNNNFYWLNESYGLGFGQNNNYVFSFCERHLGMKDDDLFIVFNPDVYMEVSELLKLTNLMCEKHSKIGAINLYTDIEKGKYDNSIRIFPSFFHFVKSFLGYGNDSIIEKSKIVAPKDVDWAAGSFLAFVVSHYRMLGGFDESYFMYCEDIDICFRSQKAGESVTFFPQVQASHLAKHANRKLLSKHFFWHISSALRFLLTFYGLRKKTRSGLKKQ